MIELDNIELFVFDMAGTTVDEGNTVYKTLQKTISELTQEVSLETVLEYGAGKEKHQAIKDVLMHLGEDVTSSKQIFEKFKKDLDTAYKNLNVKPINGVNEVLLTLVEKGKKVVLNTGYNKEVAENLIAKLDWEKGKQFHFLITSDDVKNGRPMPDMIIKAMELTSISNANKVLKAGDSAIDIKEGKNANCAVTIGVLSGAQTKEQLEKENPTLILNSLKDILTYL